MSEPVLIRDCPYMCMALMQTDMIDIEDLPGHGRAHVGARHEREVDHPLRLQRGKIQMVSAGAAILMLCLDR